MRRRWPALTLIAILFVLVGGLACRKRSTPPPSAHPVHQACKLDRGRCERLCQGCDDRDDCFYRGGECLRRKGAVVFKKDENDSGDDVFSGGCHYECSDSTCTQNATFLAGDACLDSVKIAEWTQSRCHDSCLSVYDCDGECKRRGKPGGECSPLADFCGIGRSSAICKCVGG